MLLATRRHVLGSIEIKEAGWLQEEADVGGRHHGTVFRARNVRLSHCVADPDVGAFHGAILARPADETVSAAALVRIIAGTILFFWVEWRDPDVVLDEPGPLPPPGVRGGEWYGVVSRQEAVADGIAHRVPHPW